MPDIIMYLRIDHDILTTIFISQQDYFLYGCKM